LLLLYPTLLGFRYCLQAKPMLENSLRSNSSRMAGILFDTGFFAQNRLTPKIAPPLSSYGLILPLAAL